MSRRTRHFTRFRRATKEDTLAAILASNSTTVREDSRSIGRFIEHYSKLMRLRGSHKRIHTVPMSVEKAERIASALHRERLR